MLIMNFPSVSIGDKDIEIEDFNYYLIQISFQWGIINSLLITGSVGTENENLVVGNFGLEYTAFDSFYSCRNTDRSSPALFRNWL